jgi:hypothetical protein
LENKEDMEKMQAMTILQPPDSAEFSELATEYAAMRGFDLEMAVPISSRNSGYDCKGNRVGGIYKVPVRKDEG